MKHAAYVLSAFFVFVGTALLLSVPPIVNEARGQEGACYGINCPADMICCGGVCIDPLQECCCDNVMTQEPCEAICTDCN